jgi:hypothetical protein
MRSVKQCEIWQSVPTKCKWTTVDGGIQQHDVLGGLRNECPQDEGHRPVNQITSHADAAEQVTSPKAQPFAESIEALESMPA